MKQPKQDPGVEIDSSKYFRAQSHWVAFWRQQDLNIPSFGNFLGLTKGVVIHGRKHTMMLRASAVRKVEKLASPYWYAILKAYQVRHSRTKQEREFDDNDRKTNDIHRRV